MRDILNEIARMDGRVVLIDFVALTMVFVGLYFLGAVLWGVVGR